MKNHQKIEVENFDDCKIFLKFLYGAYVVSCTSLEGIFQGVQLDCVEDGTLNVDREIMIDSRTKYLNERFGNNKESEKAAEAT